MPAIGFVALVFRQVIYVSFLYLSLFFNFLLPCLLCGPGSSVVIATGYGLDGSGDRIPVGARFSPSVQTGPGAHPATCTMGTCSLLGVKSSRGVTLTPHPILVPLFMKEWSYTSTPPMGRTACTEPQCLHKGALYLFF